MNHVSFRSVRGIVRFGVATVLFIVACGCGQGTDAHAQDPESADASDLDALVSAAHLGHSLLSIWPLMPTSSMFDDENETDNAHEIIDIREVAGAIDVSMGPGDDSLSGLVVATGQATDELVTAYTDAGYEPVGGRRVRAARSDVLP